MSRNNTFFAVSVGRRKVFVQDFDAAVDGVSALFSGENVDDNVRVAMIRSNFSQPEDIVEKLGNGNSFRAGYRY